MMKITVKKSKKRSREPQAIGTMNVSSVCPHGPGGVCGEYSNGQLIIRCNTMGGDKIGLSIYIDNEYLNENENGDTWDQCAEVVMTKDEVINLAELLIKSVKHADSL